MPRQVVEYIADYSYLAIFLMIYLQEIGVPIPLPNELLQGRFTGRNMLYLESEYRFGIRKNGLLGGMLFVNAESQTEYQSNDFGHIAPGAGTGLRIKVNKNSNTNVSIDYAFGLYGSHGFLLISGNFFKL